MKVLDCPEQGEQPWTDLEDELVEFDVRYLLNCLGRLIGTSYRLVSRPDVEQRHSRQPDYLAKDAKSGALLAIEHARFFESQETREAEACEVKRSGSLVKSLEIPSPKQLGERLSKFVDQKLAKGQFDDFNDAERILLARNRWSGVGIDTFLEAEPYFELEEPTKCDHFYIIVRKRLIQVF